MAGLGSLLGEGSTASQFLLWGVAYGFAQALLQPEFEAIQQTIWRNQSVRVLSPADLADMVIRNIITEADGANEAADSGIDGARFHKMVLDTGEPPGLELGLEMLRRGIIPVGDGTPGEATFSALVATSRLRPEWIDALLASREVPISAAAAVEAFIRGQITEGDAKQEAFATGINADRFDILANTAGRPPSLGEALELLRRKIIPPTGLGPEVRSFQQAIAEGDTKNKWLQEFLALAETIPPPRTVTALVRAGAIDQATAIRWFQDAGLSPDAAAAYFKGAQGEKLAGTRQLAQGQVLTLYESQAVDQATALGYLGRLGYGNTEARLLLELADLQRETRALNAAINRIGGYYVAHHITRQGVIAGLGALRLDGAHIDTLLATWDAEAAANVRTVTPAQVMADVRYAVIAPAQGLEMLHTLGYSPRGAWLALAAHLHGTAGLGPMPPAGGPGVI